MNKNFIFQKRAELLHLAEDQHVVLSCCSSRSAGGKMQRRVELCSIICSHFRQNAQNAALYGALYTLAFCLYRHNASA